MAYFRGVSIYSLALSFNCSLVKGLAQKEKKNGKDHTVKFNIPFQELNEHS